MVWNFLLVVVFGGYWIIRILLERSKAKEFKRKVKLKKEICEKKQQAFIASRTNIPLEIEIRNNLYTTGGIKYYWPELEAVFDEELPALPKPTPDQILENDNCHITAVRILLAKKGYLRLDDATYGLSNRSLRTDMFVSFGLWIDKKLREHGMTDRLIITAGMNYYANEITLKYENIYKFMWESMIMPYHIVEECRQCDKNN